MNLKPIQNDGGPGDTADSRDAKVWSGGEFVDQSTKGIQREIGQRQFLELARELYHVTADLRDKVLPHYAKIADPFHAELSTREPQNWFDRYRLGRPWVVKQVRETLTLWTLVPDVARLSENDPPWHPLFNVLMRRPQPARTVPFDFNFVCPTFEITVEGTVNRLEPAGWDVELNRREEFIAEARKQFEVALKSYWVEQERSAIARGLVRAKRPRRGDISLRSKMTWAVRRRCGRMGFEEIARVHDQETRESVDVSTVIKSVKEILVLVDLDNPKSRRRT